MSLGWSTALAGTLLARARLKIGLHAVIRAQWAHASKEADRVHTNPTDRDPAAFRQQREDDQQQIGPARDRQSV
jgi:hypothetical protein